MLTPLSLPSIILENALGFLFGGDLSLLGNLDRLPPLYLSPPHV